MKLKMFKKTLLTGLLLCSAGIMTAQASSTIISFSVDMATNLANGSFNPPPPAGSGTDVVDVRGAFNGWAALPLLQKGTSTVFTNSFNDTNGANGTTFDYKFYQNGNGEGTACYDNRTAMRPATSGASLVLPTHYFGDVGPGVTINVKFQIDMSEEIELGHFNPLAGDKVVIAGSFNGWSTSAGSQWVLTNDPTILITNNNFSPPVVEHNVYTVTTPITQCSALPGLPAQNSSQDFKYVEMPGGSWENSASFDSNDNGNRWLTETNSQVLPLVSFSDLPYAPLANVTLSLDMSTVARYDSNYVPNSVSVWGTFNGWANGVTLTNNPVAANTNLYKATIVMGEGASILYQFRYTNSYLNGWVYDYAQDGGPNYANNNNYRRTITLPVTSTVLNSNLPTVYFKDLAPDDVLPTGTTVNFSVDMNGALGTDGHLFDVNLDAVYINGMFAASSPSYPNAGDAQLWYQWSGGANPVPAPAGFQMIRQGSSTIYTNSVYLPAGTPVALSYQYGMDAFGNNGGPIENEAPVQSVHYRAVRSSKSGVYTFPVDTFTNQPYVEPFLSTGNIGANGSLSGGNLTIGALSAGKVPVTWLGRPGAHLQVKSSLTAGSWSDLPATDGTNWTAGSFSSNGFVSATNYPASGSTFFRLVKP